MSGRTLGGATIAIIQGTLVLVVCMLVGFRPESWTGVPLAFLFMAYGVDGLRAAFIGLSQIGLLVDVAVLAALSIVFLLLGARAFSKIQV
jgi:hypothetical protein